MTSMGVSIALCQALFIYIYYSEDSVVLPVVLYGPTGNLPVVLVLGKC